MPDTDNREYLRVEDGYIVHVAEKVLRRTREEDFIRAIHAKDQIDSGLLPFGTVAMGQRQSMKHFMIWRPERRAMLHYKDHEMDTGEKMFDIAWPCHVFGIKFQGLSPVAYHLWFAKGPIRTQRDLLFVPPLPNENEDGHLCLTDQFAMEVKKDLVLTSEAMIKYVYESRFNLHIASNMRMAPPDFKIPTKGATYRNDGGRDSPNPMVYFQAWEDWTKAHGEDWRKAVNEIDWQRPISFDQARGALY